MAVKASHKVLTAFAALLLNVGRKYKLIGGFWEPMRPAFCMYSVKQYCNFLVRIVCPTETANQH